jgi:hypothetical protein
MQRDKSFDKIYRSGMILYYGYLVVAVVYGVAIVGFAVTGWEGLVNDPGIMAWLLPLAFIAITVAAVRTREIVTAKAYNQAIRTGGTVLDGLSAAHVLRLSINELIAILGLGLYLSFGNFWLAAPLVVVGVAALYRSRPDKARWQENAGR